MEEETPSQKQSTLDLKEIEQIVDLMAKNDLSYFHLQRGDAKLELRRGSDIEAAKDLLSKLPMQSHFVGGPQLSAAPAPAPAPAPASSHSAPVVPVVSEAHGPTVNSPMVGTFYKASSPGEKPFVKIGDVVDENTVVCIIEAMKVLNEIKAEAKGTIVRVLVDDAKPVQYGQPLFELK